MSENFTVERTTIKALFENYSLSIPAFQRKFVWSNDKKQDLIESLNKSFPIGVITLFLNKDNDHYLIVDGLQRVNTIKTYLSDPSTIIPFAQFYDGVKDKLTDLSDQNGLKISSVKKAVKKWYGNLETVEGRDYMYKDFANLQKCLQDFELSAVTSDFSLFQSFRDILLQPINIEDEMIGIIKYKGDSDELPELFTKINQKTVSLTGYEILHSLWYDYTIPLSTFPQFKPYADAFKKLLDKSEGYVKLDENSYDVFNMYMNISSLEQLIEEQTNPDVKEYIDKLAFHVLKSETVFDAFSTICEKTTNRINKSVTKIFENSSGVDYSYILSLNEAIISTALRLNELLFRAGIEPYSKYFYIYFFYYVFSKTYCCDPEEMVCNKRANPVFDEGEMLSRVHEAKSDGWFKDAKRQLAFFKNKISELDGELAGVC